MIVPAVQVRTRFSPRLKYLAGMARRRIAVIVMISGPAAAGVLCSAVSHLAGTEYLGTEGVFFQQGVSDCGAAALKMIFDHYGIQADYGCLLQRLEINARGTAMLNMKKLANAEGLDCEGWRLASRDLPAIPLPAVLLLRRDHFVVLDQFQSGHALILDPARGRLRLSLHKLLASWHGETLVFHKPGAHRDRPGGWFARAQFQERK